MNKIKYILFDLDGTLLPMDQNVFIKDYFGRLCVKLAPYGYDSEKLVKAVWQGTAEMVANDGSRTNEEVFWNSFTATFGKEALRDMDKFTDFYEKEFKLVKASCGYNENAVKTVKALKEKGYRLVLATNPIFPRAATLERILWAGLDKNDFEIITTYEMIGSCKPNTEYYAEILRRIGAKGEECLMVGNDVLEDMIAEKLGMKVFLLTDCMINSKNLDIEKYEKGSFPELMEFIGKIEQN